MLALMHFLSLFRIPNFLRRLFAEGSFALAFVPIFSQYREQKSDEELQALVDRVAGTLGLILLVITALGVLTAPILIYLFASGFSNNADQQQLATAMLRLTFPYLLFISLVAFAGGILNSCSRFAVPAFTPVLLNISLILAAVYLAPQMAQPEMALAWGVFIAGIAQLLFQLPYLKALKLLPKPRWGWRHSGVQKIIQMMIPTLFSASVAQLHMLVNTHLASYLAVGSVSWLYYTDRLVEFPLGLFGVALATVILPKLSRDHANTSTENFSRTLDWGIRCVLLIGIPATIALIMLSGPLIATLFQHGAFTASDTQMTQQSLMTYSLGLLAFYANQSVNTWVFCPRRYSYSSKNRCHCYVRGHGVKFCSDVLFSSCWLSASDGYGRLCECRFVIYHITST